MPGRTALVLALLLSVVAEAQAQVSRIWAAGDGDKIERDARDHPLRGRNAVWDGRVVRLFAARNEVIAFQVIVEAGANGVRELSAALPALASQRDRISYKAPTADPTDYVGRPIQVFGVNYLEVTFSSHASWVFTRGSPAAPADPVGWKPVQLVPEHAARGRGGLPLTVRPRENQAIWIEIYVDRTRAAGLYRGSIEVRADDARRTLPVELEVFDFLLPDEN